MRYEDASQSGSFQDQGPIARDDADQLAAGDRGPATGNLMTGAGTDTGAAGADNHSGARVTAIAGAGGQDMTFAGGQLRVEGEHGSLSVTARGDYVYRANANVPENSRDSFTYTLTDAAGGASQARLTVEIGRTGAVVATNAQRIVPGPDGLAVLPAGVELSDIRIVGRDLLVMLPDGSQMVIVDGAVFVPQLVINDIEVPSTNLAALLIEQEPRPASGVPQSGGGNFAVAVGPLDPGAPLGDLLQPTELSYSPPLFRDLGLEDDLRPEVGANLPIQLDDDARAGGNAGGVGDDADGVNLAGVLSRSGGNGPLSFALSTAGAPAGFAYVAGPNGSLLVQQNGATVLTVTLNPLSGAYSITQNVPIQHAPGGNENNVEFTFGYTVTDADGDSASGSFSLSVDDDTPVFDVAAGAEAGVILTTDDADTQGSASDVASSSANFGGIFSVPVSSAGADGLASGGALSFALGTPGGASGLTQSGASINLFLIGGKVVGSTAATANAVTTANSVFDISVGSTGIVTLTLYSQIDHRGTDPSPTGAPFNDQLASLADGLVTLTASGTLSDRDGDSASDSVSIQIGANLRFSDDGPIARLDTDELAPGRYGPETGNVLTGTGTISGLVGADSSGADGAAQVISVQGAGGTDSAFDADGNLVIAGLYGTLSIRADGSYGYVRAPGTPGGVDDVFTYRVRDGDGDTGSASLTIRIGNLAPTIDAPDAGAPGTSVNESGLPERGSEPQGSGEEAAAGPNGDPSETTSGTIRFTSGDGPASVSIGGVAVTAVGQVIDTGEGGLTIVSIGESSIGYSYTLKDNILAPGAGASDSFDVVVTDRDGQSVSDRLTIAVRDDAPDARDDTDALAAGSYGPETGNVLSGQGTTSGAAGRDTLGADGARVVAVAGFGGSTDATFDADGNLVVNGQYGVLTIKGDGSYSYQRNPGTTAGVSESFAYTVRDGDGNEDSATLTIAIADAAPELRVPAVEDPGTVVFEEALGERGEGKSQGSGEERAAGANGDTGETTSGVIRFTPGDGPATVTIAGVTVIGAGQEIHTGEGVLTIDGFDPRGTIAYRYTLKDNVFDGGNGATDSFEITVTDLDGDSVSDTVTITIVDDGPSARDDADRVEVGMSGPATGNVITGEGATAGTDGRDTRGADGASLVSVSGFTGISDDQFDANGDLVVAGRYGSLTIKADGSYSYVRNPGTPGGVSDVFTYTLRDGDGDEDSATLTIRIEDAAPSVDAPNAGADGTIVFEAALGERGEGESLGSNEERLAGADGDPREATAGTIRFGQGDGPATIAIAGVTVTNVGQVIDTGEGLLTVTALAADQLRYTYVLKDNQLASGGSVVDSIEITVTDQDGDVVRDMLDITIVDDAPSATSDVDSLGASTRQATGNVLTGVDLNGGDRNLTDGNADLAGADGASVTGIASNNRPSNGAVTDPELGGLLIVGEFGTLRIAANGEYSYTRADEAPVTGVDVFTYTLTDGDGDTATATLSIGLDDAGVMITIPQAGGAATTVFEAALGTAPQGSSEAAEAGVDDDPRETVSGSIAFTARDGLGSISLGGVTLGTTYPQTIVDDAGQTLVVTGVSFDAATGGGFIAYRYTLKDNRLGDPAVNGGDTAASFALVVTDSDGDRSQGNLVIAVRDDAPVAHADTDDVTEGASANGNVVLGSGTTSGSAGTDLQGADGAVVIGVRAGDDIGSAAIGAIGTAIVGAYGTLTLNADGSYSYAARPDSVGSARQDVFTYSIRDADGDVSTTTLTITINNMALVADHETNQVDEAALDLVQDRSDLAAGTVTGSNPGSSAETATGQLSMPGATAFALVGTGTGSRGVLQLDSSTGAYTYTLISPATTLPMANDGPAVGSYETFTYVARDSDGNSVTGTIRIAILDDVPAAQDDSDVVTEGMNNVADGNVLTGTGGQDLNSSDGVSDETGADGGATVVGARTGSEAGSGNFVGVPAGTGGLVIAGTYGDLLIRADGSYSYMLKVASIPVGVTGESFTYQMRDGDGDLDVAELAIGFVQDVNVPVVVGATGTVFEDGLADGSQHGPNSETVTGSFQVGIGQEGAVITVNGVRPGVGQTVDTGEGVLTFTGMSVANGVITYDYSYTLKSPLTHAGAGEGSPILDTLQVEVTDATGDSASGTITIRIVDDVPTAAFDSDSLAAGSFGPETGNVITGAGTTSGAVGADTLGADGAMVVGVKAGSDAVAFTGNTGVVVQGLYGKLTLQADGSYSYSRDPGTPGDVTDRFSYTLRDGDGDTAVAELAIAIGDASVTVNLPSAGSAATTVFERGLAERGSEPAGSGESDDGNGTNNSDPSELTSGTITFVAKDGLGSISLGGVVVDLGATGPQTIADTASQRLVVTGIGYDPATGAGSIRYEYLLKDNSLVDPSGASFALVITDKDGDSAPASSLVITIVDDMPNAKDDVDTVGGGAAPATGNVITGVDRPGGDANASDGNRDLTGADGARVVRIASNAVAANVDGTTDGSGNLQVHGLHGTLTVNQDGSYSYARLDGGPLKASDSFSYTLRDGDGDEVTATLTIAIDDKGVMVDVPPAGGAGTTVFEAALAARGSEPEGSGEAAASGANGDTRETVTGSIAFAAPDGLGSISLGGQLLTGPYPQMVSSAASGTLVVTAVSFDAATGAGSIAYSYTLGDNASGDSVTASFGLVVTDRDGDLSQGNLIIAIVDDAPIARNDLIEQTVENAAVTFGLFGNDTFGADGVDIDNNPAARVSFTQPAQGSVSYDATTGLFTFVPATGQTGEASFTYTIEDGDGDRSTATVTVRLVGDSTPRVSDASARVDDEGLIGGLPGGTGDIDANVGDLGGSASEAVFGGRIAVDFGGDAAGSAISFANLHNTAGTVGTEAVTYTWNAATNILTANSLRGAVFTVTVNPVAGDYVVTLLQNVLHRPGEGELSTAVALAYQATDGDGDAATGRLVIEFNDDTPLFTSIQSGTANNNPAAALTTGAVTFSIGGDSPASVAGISLDTAGLRSGGFSLVTNLSGNVLTAYQDANNDGAYTAGTDTNAVFTLTVDPASGRYTFDLVRPLDGAIVNTAVGGSSSFGSGPTLSQVLERADGTDVAVVTGYNTGASFNEGVWMSTGVASGLSLSSVNGSETGWGVASNNFEGAEFFNWDFGTGPLDTQGGLFTAPAGVSLPQVGFAVFDFINYSGAADIKYLVRYTDGTFQSGTVPSLHYDGSSNAAATNWTVTAPAGKFIADIEMFASGTAPGKVDLVSLGVLDTAVNHNLGFTVTLADEDGDGASRSFAIQVADANSPSSAPATTSTARTMQTSSAVVDDTGSSSDIRTSSTNTSFALMAGLAAGFAAMPIAAAPTNSSHKEVERQAGDNGGQARTLQSSTAGQQGGSEAIETQDERGSGIVSDLGEPTQRFGGVDEIQSVEPPLEPGPTDVWEGDAGTEPGAGDATAAHLFGGGEIHLPASDQIAAFAGKELEPVQSNPALESILVDALSGGEPALDLDQVIEAAIREAGPVQHNPVDGVAIHVGDDASHGATPFLAAVSGWDGSDFSPLFMGGATAMETTALHADAIQPIANG